MRRLLLVVLVSAIPLGASGDDKKLEVRAETRRRYLWIGADGTVGVASGTAVTARVLRGTRSALEQTTTAGAGGSFHVELRTTARLLPDEYELEVLQGTQSLGKTPFRVGMPEEAEPARERLRSWLVNARGALRDMAASLERRGEFHRLRLLDETKKSGGRPDRRLAEIQTTAWTRALDRFTGRYRSARMDFVPYEREVLLSPFPEAGEALSGLFSALLARRKELGAAFEEALAGREAPLAPPSAILELARRSAKGLGLEGDDAEAWGAGPLGKPESAPVENGKFTSALGATLEVPSTWEVADRRLDEDDGPEDRVFVKGPNAIQVWLHVRELPGEKKWDDLGKTVESLAWEEWGNLSYKKLEAKAAERSYEIQAKLQLGQTPMRLLISVRAPKAGMRLFELRAVCPEAFWAAHKTELEKIAASFALGDEK